MALPHLAHLGPAEMDRMDRAADYTDEWFTVGEGTQRMGLRVYYVCDRMLGDQTRCPTLITSST